MVGENGMYQQPEKICREKVCRIKVFREKLGKISSATRKIACSYTYGQGPSLLKKFGGDNPLLFAFR